MLISTATMPVYNNSNNNDRVFWAHLENAMRLHYYRGKNKLVKTYWMFLIAVINKINEIII